MRPETEARPNLRKRLMHVTVNDEAVDPFAKRPIAKGLDLRRDGAASLSVDVNASAATTGLPYTCATEVASLTL